jgi:hypothetical protein
MATASSLPVVLYEGKKWFLDSRLRQIRNIRNPHDYQDLNDFELEYVRGLAEAAVRIVWKDEGRNSEGRSIGPAYTENAAGDLVENFGWITWKEANETAERLGIELDEI